MVRPSPTYQIGGSGLSNELAERATLLATCIRNAIEGVLHGGELERTSFSDEQMAILNPVVRDAIATGLHAEIYYFSEAPARSYLDFQSRLIPNYWERPELLDEYKDLWDSSSDRDVADVRCKRCGRAIVDIGRKNPQWTHLAADGGLSVGRRAASFTASNGWEEIPKWWRASPAAIQTNR
jgi:hypothetical protein